MLEIMNWKEFLPRLLKDFRLSSSEFEIRTGVSNVIVSNIKTGRTDKPAQNTIGKIEEALKIKIDDSDPENISYRKIELQQSKFDNVIPITEYPVLSEVFAGEPNKIEIEYHDIKEPFPYYKAGHNCFALKVNGSSMETTLRDGDVILVDMSLEPMNGDLVAVKLKNGNQYIKRFYKMDNEIFIKLTSDNSEYGVRLIDTNDIVAIHPVVSVNFNIRNVERRK